MFDINYSWVSLWENAMTWDIDANNDYAPLVDIITPDYWEVVSWNYNISWSVNEPNNEDYLTDIIFSGGGGTTWLWTWLLSGITNIDRDTTLEQNWTWEIIVTVCEVAWLDSILCSTRSHVVVVDNDLTPPNISFTDDVDIGPVQLDTITVNRDDASVKLWMYDGDWICSANSWDYTFTDSTSLNKSDEVNNWIYKCLNA